MRNALVTGGAGFIGSHLSRRLLEDGWNVTILDNLSTGYRDNIPEGAEFYDVDISNEDFISKLPNTQYDVVFHLAAQSSGEISFDDSIYDFKTNSLSTLVLLDWCLKNNINRFIYTSSMSIYGDQDVQPVKTNFCPSPKSFYGAGKLASESYVNLYSQMGINTTSLRLFNVYGPGQNMNNLRQGMVSIYMAYILKNQEILVKGSPDRYRDLVYIDDVVEAYIRCLDRPETYGKTYNVATGMKTTVKDLLNAELNAFGYDISKYPIKYGDSTPGDTFGISADMLTTKNDLCWEPRTTLDEGLKKMVKWALSYVDEQN